MRIKTPTIRDYAEFNRRDFLRQVSCAFAVVGVGCTIPAQVHAEEPTPDPVQRVDGLWVRFKMPARVCLLRRLTMNALLVVTYDGHVMTINDAVAGFEAFRFSGCDVEYKIRSDTIDLCVEHHGVAMTTTLDPEFVVCNDGMTFRMEDGEWHG